MLASPLDNGVGKGTYVLLLHAPLSLHLTVGRFGAHTLPAGWYAYVGSAYGSGGLRGRLNHHLTASERPHWHIDYLRQATALCEIWYAACRLEHEWAHALRALPDSAIPIRRFGASDCHCESHLFHFPARPVLAQFKTGVGSDDISGVILQKPGGAGTL